MPETAKCGRCEKDDYAHMWGKAGHRFRCPNCDSTNTEVADYDMMWHDGRVICSGCGLYIRAYDAG